MTTDATQAIGARSDSFGRERGRVAGEHFQPRDRRDQRLAEVMAERAEKCGQRFRRTFGTQTRGLDLGLMRFELTMGRVKFSDEFRLRAQRDGQAIDQFLDLVGTKKRRAPPVVSPLAGASKLIGINWTHNKRP